MNKINYKSYVPLVIFIVLIILSFFVIKPFLLAIFLGCLIAYLFYPLYQVILKKLKNQSASSLLVCFFVFLILVVPSIFFVKTLVQESYVVYLIFKQKLAVGIFTGCEQSFCKLLEGIGQNPDVQFQIQEILKAATNLIIQKGSSFLLSLPRILINLFVLFFTLFYALIGGKQFIQGFNRYLYIGKNKYSYILKRLKEIIHGVVYGYLLIALFQGAIGALGFFIFGISSPLFWGLVMALLALIPFLGTGFVWVPASLILFLDGLFQGSNSLMIKGVALFVYGLIFIGSLDNIIRPKLVGDKAKVHPAIILLGVFGGIVLFGPLGVIIGPLLLSLTAVIIDIYFLKKNQ